MRVVVVPFFFWVAVVFAALHLADGNTQAALWALTAGLLSTELRRRADVDLGTRIQDSAEALARSQRELARLRVLADRETGRRHLRVVEAPDEMR